MTRFITLTLLLLSIPPSQAEDGPAQRVSPHYPDTPYDADDPSCAACHLSIPPRGAPPAEARLRTEPAAACATCHAGPIHRGVAEHVGRILPEARREALPSTIPLGADGAVQCWSCHDVHAGGGAGAVRQSRLSRAIAALIPAPEGTLPGAPRPRPALLALPLEGGALCKACHGEGP